jgi:hypothetical protein
MPRGRPAMDCDVISTKPFQRKTEKYIKKAQDKKCASRSEHPVKPCKKDENDKCVSKMKASTTSSRAIVMVKPQTLVVLAPSKPKKCVDVKPMKTGTKTEKRKDLTVRCTAMGKEISKKCKVPVKGTLRCRDSSVASKKVSKENQGRVSRFVPVNF